MEICSSKTPNNNKDSELESSSCEVREFSLNGKTMWDKVVYVYDGDTTNVVFKLDGKLVKLNCRLLGIDSPEIVPKNITDDKLRNLEIT